jgi:phenylalanyl-tRNA synthetase alpha chain
MDTAQLTTYQQQARQAIEQTTDLDQLLEQEIRFLGRHSQLADWSKGLKELATDQRAEAGQRFNAVRRELDEFVAHRRALLQAQAQPKIDLSIPGDAPSAGHLHLTTQTTQEIVDIFAHLGMEFVEAPEIDYDWYAFESLNMGKDHPARDDWETFFVDAPDNPDKGKVVLRPHTTNFEAHLMETQQPPIRAITVGKTYRRQSDASHTPMFHQFEGFVVDKGLSIGNLVATLEYFLHNYFGPETKTRLRPYHFRFTEPSFEIDISCTVCGGQGCKLCKEGWLELGGAGMTHPAVLKNGGLDPNEYTGFAWGWGVERCFTIRHGISDLRMIYDNDLRFLEQF